MLILFLEFQFEARLTTAIVAYNNNNNKNKSNQQNNPKEKLESNPPLLFLEMIQ